MTERQDGDATIATIDQAAMRIRRSRRTIERYLAAGLEYFTFNGVRYIPVSSLHRHHREHVTRVKTRRNR